MADQQPPSKDKDKNEGDDPVNPNVKSDESKEKNGNLDTERELFGNFSESSKELSDKNEEFSNVGEKTKSGQVTEKRHSVPATQNPSSYGPEFPCDHCNHSYWNIKSYQDHLKKHEEKVVGCRYCFDKFPSKVARDKHEKRKHAEDLIENDQRDFEMKERRSSAYLKKNSPKAASKRALDDSNTGEDAPTSTSRANVTLAYKCTYPECHRSFSTNAGMLSHRGQIHKSEGQGKRKTGVKSSMTPATKSRDIQKASRSSPGSYDCSKCDKRYSSSNFLNAHISTCHPTPTEAACTGCGELFKSRKDLVLHQNICDPHIANISGNGINGDSSYDPPAAKRSLLASEIDDRKQTFSPKADPKREHFSNVTQRVVKTEPTENTGAPFTTPKPFRASTQSVFRGLAPTREPVTSHGIDVNRASPIIESESSGRMYSRQANQSMNSPVSFSSGGLANVTNRPARPSVPSTPSAVERIVMSPLPLTAAIFARAQQEKDNLMIVWTDSLDEDLLDAVSQNPEHSILCIRELDTRNMTAAQMKLLKTSDMFTFTLPDVNETYNLWTVISFGKDHSPIGLKNRHFNQFTDVERVLVEHAHNRDKAINNVMRGDGLFPLIKDILQEKISAYNVK